MGHTETRLMVDTENDAQGAVHGDTACSPPFLWPIVIITITGIIIIISITVRPTHTTTDRLRDTLRQLKSFPQLHNYRNKLYSCTTNPSKYCSYSITVVGCVVNYVRGKCIISTVQLRRGTVVNCGQQATCTYGRLWMSYVDNTIDLPWRKFRSPKFGSKFQYPYFLEVPKFPYKTVYGKWKEASMS